MAVSCAGEEGSWPREGGKPRGRAGQRFAGVRRLPEWAPGAPEWPPYLHCPGLVARSLPPSYTLSTPKGREGIVTRLARCIGASTKHLAHAGLGAFSPRLLRDLDLARARRRYQREPALGPTRLLLELTTHCSYRCLMCQEHSRLLADAAPGAVMPWDRLERLLREVAAMGTQEVWLAGRGEPTLYPQLLEMISLSTSLGLMACITTNGNRLTPAFADELREAGLRELSVSINSGTPETYAEVHGVAPETRARILATMQHLSHSSPAPRLVASMVITKTNAHEIVPFVRDVLEAGVAAINVVGMYAADVFPSLAVEEWDPVRRDLTLARDLASQAGVDMQVLTVPGGPADSMAPPLPAGTAPPSHWTLGCFVGYLFSRIDVDGTVHGCCGCTNSLGDITQAPFRDVWRGRAYRLFRQAGREMPLTQRMPTNCLCQNCGHFRQNAIAHVALGFRSLPASPRRARRLAHALTRLDLAEVVWRCFPEMPADANGPPQYADLTAAQAGRAWPAVAGMYAAGVMQGWMTSEGRFFRPRELATCDTAAVVLRRCLVSRGVTPEAAAQAVASTAPGPGPDLLLQRELDRWARAVQFRSSTGERS